MKKRHHAPAWLLRYAKTLVENGSKYPGQVQYTWLGNWQTGLYWIYSPAYSLLAYRCTAQFDEAMQGQLIDAFSRCSHKRLVTIVPQATGSALCFLGGAPLNIQLATLDFEAMDITRNPPPPLPPAQTLE